MVSLGTTGRTTPKARERVSQEEGETYNETKKKQTKQQVHTREAKTSQEACLIGVTQTTYSGNTRGGLGMLRGFCPPWGPTPRPAAPPGPGPAPPPETPTGRFRQDSTPKEVQRGWGGKQRKSPPRKHCFFFPPFFLVRVAQIPLQSHRLWAGGTMTIHVSTGLSPRPRALMVPLMAAPHNGPVIGVEQRLTPI